MLELKTKKKMTRKGSLLLKGSLSVLLTLLFFSSYLRLYEGEKSLVTFTQNLVYPIQYFFQSSRVFIEDSLSLYVRLSSVAAENKLLKEENFNLRAKLLEKNGLESELVRFKKLLNFSERIHEEDMLATRVVAGFNHLNSQGLRVSSGSNSGVKVGMPVVSTKGVVGKVIRTSFGFSDVSLVTDSHFVLDVLLERTRVRTLLKGDYNDLCVFEVPKQSDLKVGDSVVTSGLLGVFTKGLPVGVVSEINFELGETVKTAKVSLWAKMDSLEEVLILKKNTLDPFGNNELEVSHQEKDN